MERIRRLLHWLQTWSQQIKESNEEMRAEANILRDNTYLSVSNFQQRYLTVYLAMLISTLWFVGHVAAKIFYTGLDIDYSRFASLDNGLIYIFENSNIFIFVLIFVALLSSYLFPITFLLRCIPHQRTSSIARDLEIRLLAQGPIAVTAITTVIFCTVLIYDAMNPTRYPPSTMDGYSVQIDDKSECAIIRGRVGDYFVLTINTGLTFPKLQSEVGELRHCWYMSEL